MNKPKTKEEIVENYFRMGGQYSHAGIIALMEQYAQQFQTDGWTDEDMIEFAKKLLLSSKRLFDLDQLLKEYKESKLPAPPGK